MKNQVLPAISVTSVPIVMWGSTWLLKLVDVPGAEKPIRTASDLDTLRPLETADTIYDVPLAFHEQGLDDLIVSQLRLESHAAQFDLSLFPDGEETGKCRIEFQAPWSDKAVDSQIAVSTSSRRCKGGSDQPQSPQRPRGEGEEA